VRVLLPFLLCAALLGLAEGGAKRRHHFRSLPDRVLGFYLLVADDGIERYDSHADWQPRLPTFIQVMMMMMMMVVAVMMVMVMVMRIFDEGHNASLLLLLFVVVYDDNDDTDDDDAPATHHRKGPTSSTSSRSSHGV
jgi:uncharacterized membrane protein YhaH (DUF805 family)